MIQVSLNLINSLLIKVNEEIKTLEVIDSWTSHIYTFKLYSEYKPVPTLFIYQRSKEGGMLLLIDISRLGFIHEIIYLPKHTYQIWGNTMGDIYSKRGYYSELEIIRTVSNEDLEDDKETGSMFYFW